MKLSEIEKDIENDLIKVINLLNEDSLALSLINSKTKYSNENLINCNIKDLASIIYNKVLTLRENLNSQSKVKNQSENEIEMKKYEDLLIKSEQDIRSHIKTEFQLKIFIENLEVKVDGLERENFKLRELIASKEKDFTEESKALNEKITSLTSQINELKKQVKPTPFTNQLNIRNNSVQYIPISTNGNNNTIEDFNATINHESTFNKVKGKSNNSNTRITLSTDRKKAIEKKKEHLKSLIVNESKISKEKYKSRLPSKEQINLGKGHNKQLSKETKSINFTSINSSLNKSIKKVELQHSLFTKPQAANNKAPINAKVMSTISSIMHQNKKISSCNFNTNQSKEAKPENMHIKSYLTKIGDLKYGVGVNYLSMSKNLKTIY